MKIIHVVEPFATGINTFIHELVFGMPEHEHVIVHGEREDNRDIEEIKEEYFNKASFIKWSHAQREIKLNKDRKAYYELKRILKGQEFDILHLHSSKAGVLGRFIAFSQGYKNVIYTPNAASFLRTDISSKKKKIYTIVEKLASRIPTKIVSSSKSEYDAFLDLNINSEIIQNGTTIPSLNKKEGKDVFNVVVCGKITIQKNPGFFNQIALFFENDPNIKFTWIGDGELRHLLTSGNIGITGWCGKLDVFKYLQKSHLYLSTSSWEGLPFAPIEALSFGLPLILSNCFGNRDLVTKGVNGFVFDSKEKAIEYIELLKNGKDRYQTLSENAQLMYQRHYSNYRCAKEYEKLYKTFQPVSNYLEMKRNNG